MSLTSKIKRYVQSMLTKKTVVVLLNDSRDQESFGSQVLADTLVEIISQYVPNPEFRSIPSHWLIDHPAGSLPFIKGTDSYVPAAVWPEVADQFETVAEEWLNGRGGPGAQDYLAKMQGADLVALNGEGSIYRSNGSAIRELFLLWLAKIRLGLPTVFVNGTVHLTDIMPVLPAMVRKAFSVADAVAVREPFSHRNVQAYAPQVSARMIPDAAWIMQREVESALRLSPELENPPAGGYFIFDPGGMLRDHRFPGRSALGDLLHALSALNLQPVVIVKQAPYDDFLFDLARSANAPVFGKGHSYLQLMALQAKAAFQVSSRYHDFILGSIMGCPTVALASGSHKVHGACELMGGAVGRPFDGTDLRTCTPEIVAQAQGYLTAGAALRQQLAARSAQLATDALAVGELVRGVLGVPKATGG